MNGNGRVLLWVQTRMALALGRRLDEFPQRRRCIDAHANRYGYQSCALVSRLSPVTILQIVKPAATTLAVRPGTPELALLSASRVGSVHFARVADAGDAGLG
jgi:hypothetical protein